MTDPPEALNRLARRRLGAGLLVAAVLVLVGAEIPHASAQTGSTCPCTIWPGTATPAVANDPDGQSVEVGVEFRSDTAGVITGLRFYKGPLNTGTHTGSLWTATGTLLGRVTFANETASGWQQANFATPVAISASATYVASYFTTSGRYSVTEQYFQTAVDSPPLHALANAVTANGVYQYATSPGFPTQTYRASNYWVDVVFSPVSGTDTTSPTVTSVSPPSGATGVSVATTVTATFSEALDPATVTTSTFQLRNSAGTPVTASVAYDGSRQVATLTPTGGLAADTAYTATVVGGTTDPRVKDPAGNALASSVTWTFTTAGGSTCAANPIVCENQKPGNQPSDWDVSGAGDPSIQGFATDISVNKGETVHFKIDTNASAYHLDIYRMGYYGGNGARKIATVLPSAALPQTQPACLSDSTTGLIDCGNWAESSSWAVPADATSGIYFAKLVRDSGPSGASHVMFVVRDDLGQAPILFQTSDTTWQAYNRYGGNSLYVGSPAGRAYKVSYNRPMTTRDTSPEDFVFNAEYPMVRWLEANGYDVSYWAGVDTDRRGSQLLQRRLFLSVGHDEYWSGAQRANVEAARNAGMHLAFFSGNEIFWKTRYEASIDGSQAPYRTLVCYKETHANAKIDPLPDVWTGTWRDPRFSPPADGGRPENALSGTIFMVNEGATTAIAIPEPLGKMRFWRNTTVAALEPGTTATMPQGTVGYEWDEDLANGARPPGLIALSSTTLGVSSLLLDYGSTYGPGTATHTLTLYRHASGALVFGAGTVQWSWGLDSNHDRGSTAPDVRMQQATVNLLADMRMQPATLQPGLVGATASADTTAPTSAIGSPAPGATLAVGQPVTISGTATDTGGVVAAVEVSVDNGATWWPASGRTPWSFNWTPSANGSFTVRSRAVDDSGLIETPSAGVTVTVGSSGGGGGTACPCSLWASSATPAVPADADTAAVEVGVKFQADVGGVVSGIRFYKASSNTGTHVGNLWTSAGQLLGSVTFTNETASGWQQANFPAPVAITANTVYVASYHTSVGHYSVDENYFATAGVDRPPLHAPATTVTPNGVYVYSAGGAFPTQTFSASNYWVDPLFSPSSGGTSDTTPPTVTAVTPSAGTSGAGIATTVTATFSEAMDPTTITASTFDLRDPSGVAVAASVAYNQSTLAATLTPASSLATSTAYTATIHGGASDPRVKDLAGNPLAANMVWSFTTTSSAPPPSACPCTIWASTSAPAVASANDNKAVELGVKFKSDLDGFIKGIRFYKGVENSGTHVGSLWTSAGQLLASATFAGESATGWQQVTFTTPVAISANTVYVASYHTNVGFYAGDGSYFASTSTDRPPLHALANSVSPNGVYAYGTGGFPNQTFNATNYWVDVVFDTTATSGPDTTPPTVVKVTPPNGTTGTSLGTNVTVTFSEAMDPTTITTTTVQLRDPSNALVPAAVTYDGGALTATLDPTDQLAASTTYRLSVLGGTTDPRVKDLAGNALASTFTSSFSTGSTTPPPGPGQGSGGPILVITSAQNKFTSNLAEILGAEGLNFFTVADVSTVTSAVLAQYDVAVLGEMPLTDTQVTVLSDWVTSGGKLVAMRPAKQLSPLLGLSDEGSTLSNAYLLVDTSQAPGAGIVGQTIQFKGMADRYTTNGATAIATLYSGATTSTSNPAVTLRRVGVLGGQAAAFTYDLARSVAYMRQGAVAWAGEERDGVAPIRSDDLYYGAAPSDVQPDWIDLDKVGIPQADEQQRLLVNLILFMNEDRKPLPRFWYLPRGQRAVVVMTGDDHGNGGTSGRFDRYAAVSAPGCSVEDWECVRSTSYIYVGTPLTDSAAAAYDRAGFEIGVHVNTGCGDWTPSSLLAFYDEQLASFQAAYPSLARVTTNRTHCVVWSDWGTQPAVEGAHAIRLDTTYYYWPPSWVADRPGFFTGSGLPMRFVNSDGTVVDVYQATTQMTDESGQSFPFTVDTLLDRALGAQGYYGVFTANMHTDSSDSAGSDAIVASAQARGVPIVSARQMLAWIDGRNASSFGTLTWNGTALGFTITVGTGANGLQAMVPASSAGRSLVGITLDGSPISFAQSAVKGVTWAIFPAAPGTYLATYTAP